MFIGSMEARNLHCQDDDVADAVLSSYGVVKIASTTL
jgi:hypothetical protein